jgi:hypothetical protein
VPSRISLDLGDESLSPHQALRGPVTPNLLRYGTRSVPATKCKHSCKYYNAAGRRLRVITATLDRDQSKLSRNHEHVFSSTTKHCYLSTTGTPSALAVSRPTRHVNRRWTRAASALPGDPDVSRLSHGAPRYGAVTHPATGQLRVGTHEEGLHLASSQGQVRPFFCCALKATGFAAGRI